MSKNGNLLLAGRDHRFTMRPCGSAELDLSERAQHYTERREPSAPLDSSEEAAGFRIPIYPYSKGLKLVNDGVAYGEALFECRIIPGNSWIIDRVQSVRTRTGKQPIARKIIEPKPVAKGDPK